MTDTGAGAAILRAGFVDVGRQFAETARLNPQQPALVDGGRTVTYAELAHRVGRLAAVMQSAGVGHGDRVALLARNCAAYLETELAAATVGAVSVNLNWRFSTEELRHGLELTGPRFVVAGPDQVDALGAAGRTPDLVIGPGYEAALARVRETPAPVPVGPEDGLVIIFTSGTTGLPKGAVISHRAMLCRALIFASELRVPRDDTFVAWAPLFHMGANDFALATLLRGGRVVVIDGYRPGPIIQAIERFRVSYLIAIPGMVEDFVSELRASGVRPQPVGVVGAMADLVPRSVIAEVTTLLDAPYLNTFGSTETGMPPASANAIPVGEAPVDLPKRQSGFCEVRLVDANGRDVPDGEPGECAIRGPSLFSGYWANDAANREAFRDGWFHMGDAFRRRPDGLLDFVDRVKYMIKSGGENIYPAEIERHVLADPRILDAAVVRRTDARWGEVPVLFAASSDPGLTTEAVLDMCRGRIASYKLPKEVHFIDLDQLPRSVSGKIQRHVLEQRLEDGPAGNRLPPQPAG